MANLLTVIIPASMKFGKKLDDLVIRAIQGRDEAPRAVIEEAGGTKKEDRTLSFRFRSHQDAWNASLRVRHHLKKVAQENGVENFVTCSIKQLVYRGKNANATPKRVDESATA